MKDTKDACCGSVNLSQERNTYPALSYNKTSIHENPKGTIKPEHDEAIPMAGILVAKDKTLNEAINMEAEHKMQSEEELIEKLKNDRPSPMQKQTKGKARKLKGSDKATFTSFECLISNGTEDLGTDTGKAKESESVKKKRRSKVRSYVEVEEMQNEFINAKMKKLHTSYKKKETREGTTMKFFSFDWFEDQLSKYSIGIICVN